MLSYYYEIMQLRSEVIQKVLETKDEHCKAVKISESFIHSSDVRYPFTDNTEDVKLYTLTEIARMAVKQEVNVLDRRGWNPIAVQDLLLYDPYASTNLMSELFSTKHSIDEKMRSQVLEILKSESEEFIYPWHSSLTEQTLSPPCYSNTTTGCNPRCGIRSNL